MLPHIKAQDGDASCGVGTRSQGSLQRVVLVGRGGDGKFIVCNDEPCPARTKDTACSSCKLCLEAVEVAECTVDGILEIATGSCVILGLLSASRGQVLEEEPMIPCSTSAPHEAWLTVYNLQVPATTHSIASIQ